jgi:hypothetical protein
MANKSKGAEAHSVGTIWAHNVRRPTSSFAVRRRDSPTANIPTSQSSKAILFPLRRLRTPTKLPAPPRPPVRPGERRPGSHLTHLLLDPRPRLRRQCHRLDSGGATSAGVLVNQDKLPRESVEIAGAEVVREPIDDIPGAVCWAMIATMAGDDGARAAISPYQIETDQHSRDPCSPGQLDSG